MDQDAFTEGYIKLLARKLEPYGYEPEQLVAAIWSGTAAMVGNDDSKSNEEAFWENFYRIYGEKGKADRERFDEFYRCEFRKAKELCGYNPKVPKTIRKIKEMGIRLALAANPIFPGIATQSRVQWAGLSLSDFELYTTYENIGFCKPNPNYYRKIAERMKVNPEECLMVGNDVGEDMVAEMTGMKVFLLTDCLINREHKNINQFPRGSFEQLIWYIDEERKEYL